MYYYFIVFFFFSLLSCTDILVAEGENEAGIIKMMQSEDLLIRVPRSLHFSFNSVIYHS